VTYITGAVVRILGPSKPRGGVRVIALAASKCEDKHPACQLAWTAWKAIFRQATCRKPQGPRIPRVWLC
jgi:hypothetical protein